MFVRVNFLFFSVLVGCGPAFLDEPATIRVTAKDVVGAWQFHESGVAETITVIFRRNGTFSQAIRNATGAITKCPGGTWKLSGKEVELAGYISAGGAKTDMLWWMVDDPKSKNGVTLFGGHYEDPDMFMPMRRMPAKAGGAGILN